MRYFPRLFLAVVAALTLAACNKSAPKTETAASKDSTPIRYEAVGKGDVALVFVHCWTCNRGFWDAQAAYFAPRFQVVRLDLAGHGESGKEQRKDYTVEAFGDDVAAVVNQLGLKKVILIGHSLGGPVVVAAEKSLGDRVIGVVAVDAFYTDFDVPKDEKVAREFSAKFLKPFDEKFAETTETFMRSVFGPNANAGLVDRIAKNAAAADRGMALSAIKNDFSWYIANADAELKRVGAKLRNINADPKDEDKKRHDSVVLIAGAGHFVAQEKPAEFNRALEQISQEFIGKDQKK